MTPITFFFFFSGDGHGSVSKFSVVSENQVLIFWVLIYLCVVTLMESSYILSLLPTRWQCFKHWMDIPFRTGAVCLYIPSKSPATPGWLEGAIWLLHHSISNFLFFYISSSKSGNHSCFRSMSGSHFNPRYLLQSFPRPPKFGWVRMTTWQKPSSWTRSCPPAWPRVPSRLWTL